MLTTLHFVVKSMFEKESYRDQILRSRHLTQSDPHQKQSSVKVTVGYRYTTRYHSLNLTSSQTRQHSVFSNQFKKFVCTQSRNQFFGQILDIAASTDINKTVDSSKITHALNTKSALGFVI